MTTRTPANEGKPGPDRVTVVVPTMNRAERLRRLLDGLAAQTIGSGSFEVIVVDDGSTDSTGPLLERERQLGRLRLRVIALDESGGPAHAREIGWRATEAALIAFTDDDCVPTPGWLEAGLRAAADLPRAVLQGRTEPDPADASADGPFSRTISVTGPDPGFQTCNILYPREVLEAVGGFDFEAFPAVGGEDTDLGWRAIAAGFEAKFVPEALVHHAIADLGPAGRLRHALRWGPSMLAYKRHRGLRELDLVWGLFWKRTHRDLFFGLLGLCLRPLPRPLRLLAGIPYMLGVYRRARAGGGPWWIGAYLPLVDAAEVFSVLRGALRARWPLF